MKKIKYILWAILLVFVASLNFQIFIPSYAESNSNSSTQSSSSSSNELSNEDWKIIVDEKNDSKEFSFIQKNLESSNLSDNGHFLLISGFILIVLALFGIIFFSIKLYKLSKNTCSKKHKHKASHY